MRDRGWIAVGLLVFLGVVLVPAWYNLAAGRTAKGPSLKLSATEKECVAPISYMKTSHMKLLAEWRDLAVRSNQRTYSAQNGRTFAISLTGTCLQQCHTDKAEFCDRCHAYSGVQGPYCWDCHVDPRPDAAAARPIDARSGGQDGR
jgi:hypothetical protein